MIFDTIFIIKIFFMKTKFAASLILFCLFQTLAKSQTFFVNTGFEKTDTIGKSILNWETITRETEYMLDSANKVSGNYSLYMLHPFSNDNNSGQNFSMQLPKLYYAGMRSVQISLKIREKGANYPSAGLWCKIKKSKKLIGWASTHKGQIAFPMDITEGTMRQNIPIIPWSWNTYSFNISIDEDPDEVVIGGFSLGSAWFDDIEISINGKPITDFIIQLKIEEN